MRTRLFLEAARVAAALPHFRGKTRLLLALYRALGLAGRSIVAWTRLRRPVPFRARLDLQSWLQRVAFITGGYEGDTVRFLMQLHDLDVKAI